MLIGGGLAAAGLFIEGFVAFVVLTVATWAALWWAAPAVVLRSLRAQPSLAVDDPRLHNLVDGLCATMGLPRPALCLVDSPVPNALSVGRDPQTASVVVTTGLAESLSLVELEGVLAHELVHVKRADSTIGGVAVLVAYPVSIVRGTRRGAEVVHGLVGRGREYSADQRAADVVRYPPGIGAALDAMAAHDGGASAWPPVAGRAAALTRWLWVDPMAGEAPEPADGDLDDTRVRAAALALRSTG